MGLIDKAKEIAEIIDPSAETLAKRKEEEELAKGATPEDAKRAGEKAAKGADSGGAAAAAAG